MSATIHTHGKHGVLRMPACMATGLAGVCISIAATTATATDYQFNPRVELQGAYDDNANLAQTSAAKIAAADALLDARVDLLAQEPNWQWKLTPEVRGSWYPSHTDLDSDGEFLYLSGQRAGPRYTLGVYGVGSSQSLLRSYLPTANLSTGLGTPEPGTTVGTLVNMRQNYGYLSPSYALQMTPRYRLELNVNYAYASYTHQFEGGYTDYRNLSGSAGLVVQETVTGSLAVRATGANFRPDLGLTTNTYGGEVQWDGKFSPTKQYYLRLGAARTNFSGSVAGAPGTPISTAGTSASTNVSAGAGTHWTYSVTEIFIDATRNVEPTALGYAVNDNQLRLRVARRFTPRFAGFLGVRAIYDQPVKGSAAVTAPTQRYNFGTTGFEWRVQRGLSVIGAYDFTDSHYGGPSARSNTILVSLVYEPHRPAEGPAITVGY